jgi:glutathione S-transferase
MYTLYNVRRWGSLAPHLVLEELDIPYQNVWMTAEEVRDPAFRHISPLGYVPALRFDDGRTMAESAAIVAFLTAAHPEAGLQPENGTSEHAVYLSWLALMAANLYPAINLAAHADAFADNARERQNLQAKAAAESNRLFDVIERRLAADGPFLLGEKFSAADLYLFMLTVWAKPSEASLLARSPATAKVSAAVRARPRLKAVLEAHGVLEPAG